MDKMFLFSIHIVSSDFILQDSNI